VADRDSTTVDSFVRAVARVEIGLAPGQVLDDTYQLVQRIGGGGMGVVYRARDVRLGRDVAIKLLKPGDGAQGEHLRQLFEREARTTAQLLHPNIVTLHHIGEHQGHPYLVLELLGGETVAERIQRAGALPLGEALAIFDGVLAALGYAHERGVLHRDIKPSNVFVTLDHRIKVLDFGVAFSLATVAGTATRSAGTPGYMAPEQAVGAAQDARTDLWAATRLFAECVAGRFVDLQDAIGVVGRLPLPPPVSAMLARSLAIDPQYRPGSIAELRAALAAGPPAAAPAAPAGGPDARPAPPPAKRARWAYAVVGIAALAAVVAVAASRSSARSQDGGAVTPGPGGSAGGARPPGPIADASVAIAIPPPADAPNAEVEACKTLASIRQWAQADACARKIAGIDRAAAVAILDQVARETPNEAIFQQLPTTLQEQGIAAGEALVAKLSAHSVYQDDAKNYIDLAKNLRETARRFGEEGDCEQLHKAADNKLMVYEVAHIACRAEPDDPPCKAQDVLEDARFESNRGNAKKALQMIEGLIACQARAHQPTMPGTEFRALEVACLDHDEAAAKAHFARIAESSQRSAIRFCHTANLALP